jgi:hypothetical protein
MGTINSEVASIHNEKQQPQVLANLDKIEEVFMQCKSLLSDYDKRLKAVV